MIEWGDKNIPYLLMGLLAFWGPVLAYGWTLRSRGNRLVEEESLLREEMQGGRPGGG